MGEQDERMDFLKSKVEDVSKPGGEAPGKHKEVKEAMKGSDLNLASLMAHEDADTISRKVKKSQKQQQGGNGRKEGKSRKKRSQPENVQSVWNDEGKAGSRISGDDLKFTPAMVGMSAAPSK